MSDNLVNGKSDWPGDTQPPQSKETQSQQPAAAGTSQGRRVTIGGMNRRGSLGFDQINDALFGRRPSGFDLDNLFGRRGSLDSTTAGFDATLMDLTRRRLSMAGGANDPLSSIDSLAGIGGMNFNLGNMGAMNSMASLPGLTNQTPTTAATASKTQDSSSVNARQQQLQDQQRELERKQKELERQRQQLLSAMGERRLAIQHMHQQMQLPQSSQQMGMLMGMQNPGLSTQSGGQPSATDGSGQQQWFVCKICNAKAFSNREEASAHESICMMGGPGAAARRSSLTSMRRSSLDLLGTLAGGTASTPDIFAATHNMNFHLPSQVQSKLTSHGNNEGPAVSEHMSNGPFAMMEIPFPLSMDLDKDWLTPLHCFVRKHCVHVFTASVGDVATPSKGKRKPIQVGQVGIRCPHCHQDSSSHSRERGSVYYPTSIASIYNATMNLLQRHLHNCSVVPPEIMARYEMLKGDDARSGTSKKYWVKSAVSLGLVDTPNGIRYSGVPHASALPQNQSLDSSDFFKSNDMASMSGKLDQSSTASNGSNGGADALDSKPPADDKLQSDVAATGEQAPAPPALIVTPDDESYATSFSYHLLGQMQPCVFAEADRLGKRKGLPPGFAGLACKHCYGGYGSGRFFPSSIKTLSDTSKTLNVLHNHMMRCRKCPLKVRETLTGLRKTHDEERAKMKFGSQKAFFARIWDRLHYKDPSVSSKRKFQPARVQPGIPVSSSAVTNFLPGGMMGQHPGGMMGQQPFNTNQMNMLEALNTMQNMQNMQYGAGAAGDHMDSNKRFKMA
jgi:hypothetical protein